MDERNYVVKGRGPREGEYIISRDGMEWGVTQRMAQRFTKQEAYECYEGLPTRKVVRLVKKT